MEDKGWGLELEFPLVGREIKPRQQGLTMVLDKGLGLRETEDLVDLAVQYIDFWKLSFGTSFLYPQKLLQRKIDILISAGIDVYPGGTALEVAVQKNKWREYLHKAKKLGFTALEISDGTIKLARDLRTKLIKKANQLEFKVLTEVGKKNKQREFKVKKMSEQLKQDLEVGADKVIIEARESGTDVSIFNQTGEVKEKQLKELLSTIEKPYDIIWEAPLKKQQVYFINQLGNNVNLGNINPREILAVESLRNGLRGDTLTSAIDSKVDTSKEVFVELKI